MLALLLFVAAAGAADFAQQCSDFARSSLPNTTIWFTEVVAGGTVLPLPENNATCALSSQVVPHDVCRIAARVATSNRSEISMEAWLPRNWTGR